MWMYVPRLIIVMYFTTTPASHHVTAPQSHSLDMHQDVRCSSSSERYTPIFMLIKCIKEITELIERVPQYLFRPGKEKIVDLGNMSSTIR